jgi:hypothetical protein
METSLIGLKKFEPSEIIFSDEEIIQILLFFFPGYEGSLANFSMNHSMREFAQGLLIEAIDASYAMGFVEIIFRNAYAQPGLDAKSFIKTFAKKATKAWLKHLKPIDFEKVKIYDTVKNQLSISFKTPFTLLLSGAISKNETAKAFVSYATATKQNKTNKIIWG